MVDLVVSSIINESVIEVSELLSHESAVKGADKIKAGTVETSGTEKFGLF